jgi:hypothetical protein
MMTIGAVCCLVTHSVRHRPKPLLSLYCQIQLDSSSFAGFSSELLGAEYKQENAEAYFEYAEKEDPSCISFLEFLECLPSSNMKFALINEGAKAAQPFFVPIYNDMPRILQFKLERQAQLSQLKAIFRKHDSTGQGSISQGLYSSFCWGCFFGSAIQIVIFMLM